MNYSNESEVLAHVARMDRERAAFNRWFAEQHPQGEGLPKSERMIRMHAAWEAWKARAKFQPENPCANPPLG